MQGVGVRVSVGKNESRNGGGGECKVKMGAKN